MSTDDRVSGDEEERILDEEYRVWKKNSPFLYDFVMTYSLEWPSLTIQWLPDVTMPSNDNEFSRHKLVMGTQTDSTEPNYLMIADVQLPNVNTPVDARKYDDERREVGGFGGTLSKFNVKVKICHDGDVHRVRYEPHNPFVLATKSPKNEVLVFDYSKHPSTPADAVCRPQHRCLGHTEEGYGIDWNPLKQGTLLSASADTTLCMWDLAQAATDVNAHKIFRGHTAGVEDCAWSPAHSRIFASVGNDSKLIIWDSRQSDSSAAVKVVDNAHFIADSKSPVEVNCVAFHPRNEFLLATGGSDGVVKLWDLRSTGGGSSNGESKVSALDHFCSPAHQGLPTAQHELRGHTAGVYQLRWSPDEEAVLASSSEDRRVMIWDTSRIGDEQTPEEAEDGPPELLFVHGGHTAKVFDFDWNLNESWFMASVAEDNVLQVWQMAETIYCDDESDEEDDLEDDDLESDALHKRKKNKQ